MKHCLLTLFAFVLPFCLTAQITDQLPHFEKVVTGPRISMDLQSGQKERIEIEYHHIDDLDIIYKVKNKTLYIYLDGDDFVERSIPWERFSDNHWDKHRGAHVHATIDFKELTLLTAYGDEDISVLDPIRGDQFKIRLFGDMDVLIESLDVDLFKAHLYGENDLEVVQGFSAEQIIRLYGNNEVYCENLKAYYTRSSSYGDNHLTINTEELKVTAFGDSDINYVGHPDVSKGIVIGDTRIRRIRE